MRAEDWARVEELFHAALAIGGAERDAYLARECGADAELRREVESLVAASESGHGFIERPALSLGMRVLSGRLDESLAGRSIGHYKVGKLIGQGGMGAVYLAEDSVLERSVALKFIAPSLFDDEWAKEQLIKEARAVAKLEHQNICAVYGVEEAEGHRFIVMPYVEGETLDALLERERLGPERVLELAEQIVSALSAAHSRGIIHRDVKPQNIVVATDGQAKVLDFGIAKFIQQKQGAAEGATAAPAQAALTARGVGTAAYMSPEQARGEGLDHRSDIFSFGIVLYEMLAGRNPFLRAGLPATLDAITAEDAPPLTDLPRGLPAGLWRVARKCLEKEPSLRYATTDQLLRDLRALRSDDARAADSLKRARRLRRFAVAALALLLLVSAGAGYVYLKLSQVHTLAVLPITDESNDPDTDYLSDGFTRNLFDKFSYLPRLRVRLPSVPAGDRERDALARIGRELKSDAVLSGRVFKDGEHVVLHLKLVKAEDASLVWENMFHLNATNTLTVQDEITREVSSKLGLWFVGDALSRRQTQSEEALRFYMQGRHHWDQRKGRDDVQKAIDFYERAIDADRSYAKAYAGLAECYAFRNNVAYGPLGTKEAMEKAGYNARLAVKVGESLPEAHTSLGLFKLRYEWEWAGAEREFRRAIELDPDYAPAHYWYSNLLAVLGRSDESIREAELAKSLDPYSPLYDVNYGRALYYARRFDEAEAYLSKKLAEKPDNRQFLHMMGIVQLRQGRTDDAITTLEKLRSLSWLHAAAALGYAYGRAGREEEALGIIRELNERSKTEPVAPFEKALIYVGMGRRDEAFVLLEESYNLRVPNLINLTSEPLYDDIRTDPRFVDLARRVNLTP